MPAGNADRVESFDEYVVLGGGAVVAAFVAALFLATDKQRLVLLLLATSLVALGWWIAVEPVGVFETEEDPGQCTDCGWDDLVGMLAIAGNTLGWAIGVVLGVVVRHVAAPSLEPGGARRAPH